MLIFIAGHPLDYDIQNPAIVIVFPTSPALPGYYSLLRSRPAAEKFAFTLPI
jgi:hypothetical protein